MSLGATGKISKVAITQAGAGTLVIMAAVSGYTIRLLGLVGSMTANGTLQIQSKESATNRSGPINLLSGAALVLPISEEGYLSTIAGEGLQIVTSGGGFNGMAVLQTIIP